MDQVEQFIENTSVVLDCEQVIRHAKVVILISVHPKQDDFLSSYTVGGSPCSKIFEAETLIIGSEPVPKE